MRYYFIILLCVVSGTRSIYGQNDTDNTPIKNEEHIIVLDDRLISVDDNEVLEIEKKSKLDPRRAALLSAVLPGLGQIYNGHSWKVPIIYGGGALFGTWIAYNNRLYQIFKNDELTLINQNKSKLSPTESTTELERARDFAERNRLQYRRNRDYAVIISMLFYALNIVDAHVSAHLKEFEINDDLSMRIDPHIKQYNYNDLTASSYGLKLSLRFK